MIIETLVVGVIQANCYIIADQATKKAVVIDPGGDAPVIAHRIKEMGVDPVAIILTHGHFDHVEGSGELKEELKVPVYAHKEALPVIDRVQSQGANWGITVMKVPPPDKLLAEGDTLDFGESTIKVLHTPGHSPGSISLVAGENVFTGDLLFMGSIGRTDFPGGDYDLLIGNVNEKIFTLPENTVVYSGHGPKTTVGREKQSNPFFR